MANEPLVVEQGEAGEQSTGRPLAVLPWIGLALILGLAGYWLGGRRSAGPGEASSEAGFARDMMMHHAQAVDMATLVRDRTEDPDLAQLALDMQLTQQAQIGQMQGWMMVWGYPMARTEPAMAWMGMPTTGLMPGLATSEQLNQLRSLKGVEADILFLQLMIPHHQSGVEMAEAVLANTRLPAVSALAQSVLDAQTSEIAYMQELLQQKGAQTVPAPEEMSPDMESH